MNMTTEEARYLWAEHYTRCGECYCSMGRVRGHLTQLANEGNDAAKAMLAGVGTASEADGVFALADCSCTYCLSAQRLANASDSGQLQQAYANLMQQQSPQVQEALQGALGAQPPVRQSALDWIT